ncbi:hypothetical protein F5B19DRAFT_208037 [Rostrohypoxylon terebratum]|nr:hypothetical protein F5B19DRAFT_208037 [Rostrohypoxylon terebratum]
MPKQAVQITNICSLLGRKTNNPYIGCLRTPDETSRVLLHIDSIEQRELCDGKLKVLDDLINLTYSRDKRLDMALTILYTLLSLGSLPWIPTVLKKSRIILHATNPDPYNLQPYNSHESFRATLVNKRPSLKANTAKNCMFVLGVLLLKLLFGDVIGRQEFRSYFLDDRGQPNEYTDLCAAMKWQEKAEREHGFAIADANRRCINRRCILCSFEPAPDLGS